MLRSLGIALALLLATLFAYAGTGRLEFVDFDDPFFVLENPTVNGGVTGEGLTRAFTTTHHGQWQPVSWTSHMLDVELFGLEPAGHHYTSLALHVLNVWMLFAVFLRMTGRRGASGLVALLFAVHPLHVESVAWISSRKDLVSLLFGLVALWLYAGFALRKEGSLLRSPVRLAGVLLAYALALMGKPMLVTLPCVMLLLDVWPLGRWRGGPAPVRDRGGVESTRHGFGVLVVEKLPFFALSVAAAIVVSLAVGAEGASPELGLGARVNNAVVSYGRYLRKAVWPTDLAATYPHPSLTIEGGWPWWAVALSAGVVVILSVLAWRAWSRHPQIAVGWMWFLGTLVPVLGLASLAGHSMADRYTYLPLIGIYVALVFLVDELVGERRTLRLTASVLGLVVAVVLGAATRAQTKHWRDTEELWRHALRVTDNNYVAHANLGRLFMDRGDYAGARANYLEAIRAKPDISEPYANLGVLCEKQGQFDMARDAFRQALEHEPDNTRIQTNLGMVLLALGSNSEALTRLRDVAALEPDDARTQHGLGLALERNGELQAGLAGLRRAVELEPDSAAFQNGLGRALLTAGMHGESVEPFRRASELDPELFEARVNLGLALMGSRQGAEARVVFEQAARIDPKEPVVRYQLGVLRLEDGEYEAAIEEFEAARTLGSDARDLFGLLAYASESLGRWKVAVEHYRAALTVHPGSASHVNNLAGALWRSGKLDEAADAYNKAIELDPTLAQAYGNLGLLQQALGDLKEAARMHRRALEFDAELISSATSLAWILATGPEPSLRDGEEAVRWAQYAFDRADPVLPENYAGLAAAHAEAGRFEEAVRYQLEVLERVPEHRVSEHTTRLEGYRRGEPYRDRRLSERTEGGR